MVSCKAKYEELSVRYNNTLAKKKDAIKDRKHYESLTKTYNDSINTLLPEHSFWKRYSREAEEIVRLKSDFIKNGLRY